MVAPTSISKEEYLSSSYDPDREWVDGVLEERKVGTQRHSLMQRVILQYLLSFRESHRIEPFVEARLQVGDRYRIPAVMLLQRPYTKSRITVDVPLLVAEVKSPEDTFDDVLDKCEEYEAMGVHCILVLDPEKQRMHRFSLGSLNLVQTANIETVAGEIEICAESLFAEMRKIENDNSLG